MSPSSETYLHSAIRSLILPKLYRQWYTTGVIRHLNVVRQRDMREHQLELIRSEESTRTTLRKDATRANNTDYQRTMRVSRVRKDGTLALC